MKGSKIESLNDLNLLRTAPELTNYQINKLYDELIFHLDSSDWFTIGIMALDKNTALKTLRDIENRLKWSPMTLKTNSFIEGPVFLKANQHTGDIYIRNENGLGSGILLSCQHYDKNKISQTFGPFPLEFFNKK